MTHVAVHQFHSGTSNGDAITDQLFFIQRRLRQRGVLSNVYAEHIAPGLESRVRPIADLEPKGATLLVVHHSIGHTAFEQIANIDLPKITVFHSITPERFFDDPTLRHHIRQGFDQLRQLARLSLYGIADSNHNRREMYDGGFHRVEVLPVRTDYSDFESLRSQRHDANSDWLFVGRVVPNKGQRDLVAAFAAYRHAYGDDHLHLVGDLSFTPYVDEVRDAVRRYGLEGSVTLHGKLPLDDLLDRYRRAGLFVSLSEHEGFGVPLLEAMAAGIPVIARSSAAVPETMGGAGVLLDGCSPTDVASVARLLHLDAALRDRLIAAQASRVARITAFDVDATLNRLVDADVTATRPRHVQIQGPFETSYSLAILNRELALGLRRGGNDVTIYATEGPGDYEPQSADLEQHPEAADMHRAGRRRPFADVAIRQMYPPRVADSDAGLTFQYFGWEESGIPTTYVDDFNAHLDGIGTMSSYVRDILVAAGVRVPIRVVGVGVHSPDGVGPSKAPELIDLRTRRLLHISSAFPRKGVDVLLRAYFEAFTDDDDVTLLLKTFPNPHNNVAEILEELRDAFGCPPHVCWIDRDLDRSEIDALYAVADAYVHPARGEGFGLPVAEAMLASVPVIAVAATGLADFVNHDTATVIGHREAPAMTHLSTPGSMWVEPARDQLVDAMRDVVLGRNAEERASRVDRGRALIASEFTWDRVAERWERLIDAVEGRRTGLRVNVVSTFNSRCGIAEYSNNLYSHIGPWAGVTVFGDTPVVAIDESVERSVHRVWRNYRSGGVDELLQALASNDADVTHVQYNMGFYSIPELGRLVSIESHHRATVLTLHRTADVDVNGLTESLADIAEQLRGCAAIIVHQTVDRDRLASFGVTDNVVVIPIGTDPPAELDRHEARHRHGRSLSTFMLGGYGFLLPHKGLPVLLQALAELRARGVDAELIACCALHPSPTSHEHLLDVIALVDELDLGDAVQLETEYLEHAESLSLLAMADVIVLPYEFTNESASAAARSILPLGRAVVTSDVAIFDEVRHCVRTVPSPIDPTVLADVLHGLRNDARSRAALGEAALAHARATSWDVISARTRALYLELLSRDPRPDEPER